MTDSITDNTIRGYAHEPGKSQGQPWIAIDFRTGFMALAEILAPKAQVWKVSIPGSSMSPPMRNCKIGSKRMAPYSASKPYIETVSSLPPKRWLPSNRATRQSLSACIPQYNPATPPPTTAKSHCGVFIRYSLSTALIINAHHNDMFCFVRRPNSS
jgi:hypothetical protein